MDKHYSELDKELVRLKSELDIQDEMTNRFTAPVSTNYWQKRLEEEKELWRKRILTREEEKKTLESKIRQQDMHLKEYESKLSDIEKNFERELKNWEERFRVKEADLLLEKNRILWEEKVKDAESETRQILEKIGTLNETIAHLKDENLADKERMLAHFDEEKRTLNERIAFLESALENLKNHHIDVKNLTAVEEEKLKKEIASRLAEAETLSSEMTAISAQRNALKREIDILTARFAQEKTELERNRFAAASAAASALAAKIDASTRTAQYRQRMNMPPGGEAKIFAEEASAVLDSLVEGRSLPVPASKPAVAVLGESAQMREISAALADVLAPVAVSSLKDIPKAAPAALVADDIRMAVKAAARYPFLPVIVLTASPQGREIRIKKPPSNLHIFDSDNTASVVSAVRETELVAASSIARHEIWHTLMPRSNTSTGRRAKTAAAVIFALAAAALAAAALYIFVPISSGIKEFSVPYPLPTSVALDGKYLWSCDWQGGAIYQHELDSNLSLRRIAYFPGQSFSAMTYRSGALYTANPWSKKISRHLINDTFTVEREYSAPGVSVGAMAFAGGRLYIADGQRKVISECRLDDASSTLIVLREIPAPSSSVAGLWFDGENLWSADSAGNFVRRHRLDDALSVEAEYLLPDSHVKNFRISGFAGKGERLWISSERTGKIISLPVAKLIKLDVAAASK